MNIPSPEIIRSPRRTIALHISREGKLVVRAPKFAPMGMIQKFIEQNAEWIEDHLQKIQRALPRTRTYQDGEVYFYQGREVILTIGDYKEIAVRGDRLYFPKVLVFRIEKELTDWFIREAKRVITGQVDYYQKQMKVSHNGLTFSDTRSQWGRCTRDNRLQFSWRLIMAPLLTLNYVVVHELTHITYKDHSRDFWARVRYFNPTYRIQQKWLKAHGNSLF